MKKKKKLEWYDHDPSVTPEWNNIRSLKEKKVCLRRIEYLGSLENWIEINPTQFGLVHRLVRYNLLIVSSLIVHHSTTMKIDSICQSIEKNEK